MTTVKATLGAGPDTTSWVHEAIAGYTEEAMALSKHECDRLHEQMSDEATAAYRNGDYKAGMPDLLGCTTFPSLSPHCQHVRATAALQRFARSVGLVDGGKGGIASDPAFRASLICNIGSCLHLLDEAPLSRNYYESAMSTFESITPSRITKLLFGDINAARVAHIRTRLEQLDRGEKPDVSKYLDGNGATRQWTGPAPAMPNTEHPPEQGDTGDVTLYPLRSYLSPSAWRAWYRGEPAAVYAEV